MAVFSTLATIAAVASTAVAVKSLFTPSPKQQAAPSLPSLPEAPSVDTAGEEAKAAIDNKKRAMARNKNVYTSPLGISAAQRSDVAVKTLLGQ